MTERDDDFYVDGGRYISDALNIILKVETIPAVMRRVKSQEECARVMEVIAEFAVSILDVILMPAMLVTDPDIDEQKMRGCIQTFFEGNAIMLGADDDKVVEP